MAFRLLIGGCSGLVSALLFYSAAHGAPGIGTLLFLLTPLPSLLAGLGWGAPAAAVGALAGVAAMASVAGPSFGIGYGLALGVPSTFTACIARHRPSAAPDGRAWYPPGQPVGHLLAALALYAGLLPVLVLPLIGGSYQVLAKPVAEFYRLADSAAPELGLKPFVAGDADLLAELTIGLLPGVFAAYWLAVFSLNLYLAARILNASGRLGREWPDLAALSFPAGLSLLILLTLAAAFVPGLPAVAGSSFTGGLLFAYVLVGLALLHYVARGRWPWMLWLVYLSLVLFGPYAALLIAVAGLLEAPLGLRRRLDAKAAPPQ